MKIIITESQYRILVENTKEINQILDKLGEIGYENLENHEKNTLNKYSEWLNSGKKGVFNPEKDEKNRDFEAKVGDEYTTYLSDGSEFSFIFDYLEIFESEEQYYGSVKWHGKEWFGLIVVDKRGDLIEMDFTLDQDFQTYDSEDENEGYNEEFEKRLQDELDKKDLSQVKYFFEEEVIPHLMD